MKALDLEKLIGTKGWYFVR